MYGFIFTFHLWVQTLDQTLEWQSMPVTSSSTKVYFKEIQAEKYCRVAYVLHSYLGSWVKAWKPALEATKRRMAWKWLSSSALRAGSSASWDKRARIALLMSFSLFSENRPWSERKEKWRAIKTGNVWILLGQTDRHKSYRDWTHSHLGLLHAALHCKICWRWIGTLHLQSFHLSKGRRNENMKQKNTAP